MSIFADQGLGSPLPSVFDKENAPPTPLNAMPMKSLDAGTPMKQHPEHLQSSVFADLNDTEVSFSSSLAQRLAREVAEGHKSAEAHKATIKKQETTIRRLRSGIYEEVGRAAGVLDESVSVLDRTTASDCNASFTDELTEGLAREVATAHKRISECKATLANNERAIAELKGLPTPKQTVDDLDTTAMTEGESFVGELDATTDGNTSFTATLTCGLTREIAEAHKSLEEVQARVAASEATLAQLQGLDATAAQDLDQTAMTEADSVLDAGDQSFTDQLTEGLAREVATVHKQINECKATIAGNQRTIAEIRGLPAPKQEVDDLDTTAMTEGESFVGELDVTTDNNQSFTDELTEGLTREVASAHKVLAEQQRAVLLTEATIAQLRGLAIAPSSEEDLDVTAMTEGESVMDASVLDATTGNASFTDELTEGLTREVAMVHREIEEYKSTIAHNEAIIAELQAS